MPLNETGTTIINTAERRTFGLTPADMAPRPSVVRNQPLSECGCTAKAYCAAHQSPNSGIQRGRQPAATTDESASAPAND